MSYQEDLAVAAEARRHSVIAEARQHSVVASEKAVPYTVADPVVADSGADGAEPTDEELQTLRRVSGKIPWQGKVKRWH